MKERNKTKVRKKIRFQEYYQRCKHSDNLYARSKQHKPLNNLYPLIMSTNNIRLAYRNIKRNKGSNTPGTNNTTIKTVEKYTLAQLIHTIRKRLKNFNPHPVRRVYIPKPNGKMRPLGIPTYEDRLIQQCLKQVLEPICEAKFHPHSYGSRPLRSTKHAIARTAYLVNQAHYYYVVKVDIKGFFDNVDHNILIKQLHKIGIQDRKVLAIIRKMLKAEIKGEGTPNKGTPQGGILSPLLANVVLNDCDWWLSRQWETLKTKNQYSSHGNRTRALHSSKLKKIYLVRYVDDLKVFCKTYKHAIKTKHALEKWLKQHLNLETAPEKTYVANLCNKTSSFLGLTLRATKKGFYTRKNKKINRRVLHTYVNPQAIPTAYQKIKKQIKVIQRNRNPLNVQNLNSKILGMHNYYSMATHVSKSFNRIHFLTSRPLHNRLRPQRLKNRTQLLSETYLKHYKNKNPYVVNEVPIYPIYEVQHQPPMNSTQTHSPYTEEGRNQIHKQLAQQIQQGISQTGNNTNPARSTELNDNRISKWAAQYGLCAVSKQQLGTDFHCHHITPKSKGGNDKFHNLVLVTPTIHRLIHCTKRATMTKLLVEAPLDRKALAKLNKLRGKAGLTEITLETSKAAKESLKALPEDQ
uniref:group II intron reverse transcriptase/maturase n=1 Tax=Leontynka pallida TaxID=2912034 RepID=UPI0020282C95|nr:group II intron reverse transcriptase/maturase [Leontynka pallida]UPQ43841.1 group II intron reverse transcriptase/maturase [Leontynka pallida]